MDGKWVDLGLKIFQSGTFFDLNHIVRSVTTPTQTGFFDMVFYKLYTVFLEYNHHESGIWLDKI